MATNSVLTIISCRFQNDWVPAHVVPCFIEHIFFAMRSAPVTFSLPLLRCRSCFPASTISCHPRSSGQPFAHLSTLLMGTPGIFCFIQLKTSTRLVLLAMWLMLKAIWLNPWLCLWRRVVLNYRGIPHMGYHLASSFSIGSSFSIRDFSRNSREVSRFWPLCGTKG
jgi:hypothetical protein